MGKTKNIKSSEETKASNEAVQVDPLVTDPLKFKVSESETVIYDFNRMTPSRTFYLKAMVDYERELKEHPPQNPEERKKALKRMNQNEFYAVLLMKIDGTPEPFDGENVSRLSTFNILDKLNNNDDYENLLKARADFLSKAGISSGESMSQLNDIMRQFPDQETKMIIARAFIEASMNLDASSPGPNTIDISTLTAGKEKA